MSKIKLFDEDSEEEVAIKTENEYAKKYDAWREKEELHKLEQKYGSKALKSDASSSSDSEDESDEPVEVSEEVEKQFLKTLSLLKTKDPRIYDPNFNFFDEKLESNKEKKPETKKLTFGDSDDDDDDDDGANIFSIEKKAEIDEPDDDKDSSGNCLKEDKLKDYLTGKVEHVDQDIESDLAPLRALWSDPKINEGEAFLRDYILNKRYLEAGDAGEAEDKIRDDADLEEDEKQVEEQGKFERAYNFRFEEPDDEYLKRFPRTMNYIRPKDERRSRKRAELRDRKEDEKRQKMEEIARMKALKLKEIQQKIAKIKEVTGNQELAFQEEDIEGDFDPQEHDRRMKALFDEQYYGETDDQKPVFPDLDDELEIENWEKYEQDASQLQQDVDEDGPHCEDENFNMDADYDPKAAKLNLLEELKRNMGTKRRNRKRKSKLAQLLAEEKPKFVPDIDKRYSQFMEEYYKMDCEDVIGGDLPTRFKYREVVPNDFGLTVEEILLADDKELTQWVPLKKIVRYRPENVEKGEVKTYSQKAADERLKKKILPSLFKDLPEEPEIVVPPEEVNKKRKKKKKKKNKDLEESVSNTIDQDMTGGHNEENGTNEDNEQISKKKRKRKETDCKEYENEQTIELSVNEHETTDESIEKPKKKKKRKHNVENDTENSSNKTDNNKMSVSLTENDTTIETEQKKRKSLNDIENKYSEDKQIITECISSQVTDTSELNNKSKFHSKKNKSKNSFTVDTVVNESPSRVIDENVKSKERKNKNKPGNSFIVETINEENGVDNNKNNLKCKIDIVGNGVPKKKQKKNKNKQQSLQIKKNNIKNKTSNSEKSKDPLSNLSDERLKAYGLNPKKYRSFLKYKNF
ncbi:protein KRI1 homolog [Bicyclus anynana]|uniref:Protein KRI1 homolog n=1 Tax=Bicyclus anynana TaxID=110368 RepID=A0A6J1MUD6_BICAN|nr:protein KRI1 homolog [Bicyclus anynana]